jgi:hypothetical protein
LVLLQIKAIIPCERNFELKSCKIQMGHSFSKRVTTLFPILA